MANVVHRVTKQYLQSVNTPDYPLLDWIINPDLSSVQGFGSQYWVISGEVVLLMTQTERTAVDAAQRAAALLSALATFDIKSDVMVAAILALLDGLNAARPIQQRQTLADFKAIVQARLEV